MASNTVAEPSFKRVSVEKGITHVLCWNNIKRPLNQETCSCCKMDLRAVAKAEEKGEPVPKRPVIQKKTGGNVRFQPILVH